MNKNHFLTAFLMAAVLLVVGQFFANRFSAPLFVQAQQVGDVKKSPSQKWEYAALPLNKTEQVDFGSLTSRAQIPIYYLQNSGINQSMVEGSVDRKNDYASAKREAIARAIAKLGEDGWEMIGEGPFEYYSEGNIDTIYFKRPKQ